MDKKFIVPSKTTPQFYSRNNETEQSNSLQSHNIPVRFELHISFFLFNSIKV